MRPLFFRRLRRNRRLGCQDEKRRDNQEMQFLEVHSAKKISIERGPRKLRKTIEAVVGPGRRGRGNHFMTNFQTMPDLPFTRLLALVMT